MTYKEKHTEANTWKNTLTKLQRRNYTEEIKWRKLQREIIQKELHGRNYTEGIA